MQNYSKLFDQSTRLTVRLSMIILIRPLCISFKFKFKITFNQRVLWRRSSASWEIISSTSFQESAQKCESPSLFRQAVISEERNSIKEKSLPFPRDRYWRIENTYFSPVDRTASLVATRWLQWQCRWYIVTSARRYLESRERHGRRRLFSPSVWTRDVRHCRRLTDADHYFLIHFYTYATTRRNLSRLHHHRHLWTLFHESLEKSFRFHPRKIVRRSTFRIVSPVPTFSAFIRWTRSNAPTNPIKVCPLLILINCGYNHLSTLMVIFGITHARSIEQYFV